jgi:hypothetical protein
LYQWTHRCFDSAKACGATILALGRRSKCLVKLGNLVPGFDATDVGRFGVRPCCAGHATLWAHEDEAMAGTCVYSTKSVTQRGDRGKKGCNSRAIAVYKCLQSCAISCCSSIPKPNLLPAIRYHHPANNLLVFLPQPQISSNIQQPQNRSHVILRARRHPPQPKVHAQWHKVVCVCHEQMLATFFHHTAVILTIHRRL